MANVNIVPQMAAALTRSSPSPEPDSARARRAARCCLRPLRPFAAPAYRSLLACFRIGPEAQPTGQTVVAVVVCRYRGARTPAAVGVRLGAHPNNARVRPPLPRDDRRSRVEDAPAIYVRPCASPRRAPWPSIAGRSRPAGPSPSRGRRSAPRCPSMAPAREPCHQASSTILPRSVRSMALALSILGNHITADRSANDRRRRWSMAAAAR